MANLELPDQKKAPPQFSAKEVLKDELWQAFGEFGICIGNFASELAANKAAQGAAVGQGPEKSIRNPKCNICQVPMELDGINEKRKMPRKWRCCVCHKLKSDCSRCGAVVDEAVSARHWNWCSKKLLVPAVKLSSPPTCPSLACSCAKASFTGHSKYRIGCEDTYECTRCFKRHGLCSLCHKLVPFSQSQRHYKSCLRKEHTKGEKWASFFEKEDIPETM